MEGFIAENNNLSLMQFQFYGKKAQLTDAPQFHKKTQILKIPQKFQTDGKIDTVFNINIKRDHISCMYMSTLSNLMLLISSTCTASSLVGVRIRTYVAKTLFGL